MSELNKIINHIEMITDEKTTKKQWDRLNNDQKNSFQEEVGKTYKDEQYPSYDDILIFLGNNKLLKGDLHTLEIPQGVEDIDAIWERVFLFLNG